MNNKEEKKEGSHFSADLAAKMDPNRQSSRTIFPLVKLNRALIRLQSNTQCFICVPVAFAMVVHLTVEIKRSHEDNEDRIDSLSAAGLLDAATDQSDTTRIPDMYCK